MQRPRDREPAFYVRDEPGQKVSIRVVHYGRIPNLTRHFPPDVYKKAVDRFRSSREHRILTAARGLSPTAYRVVEEMLIHQRCQYIMDMRQRRGPQPHHPNATDRFYEETRRDQAELHEQPHDEREVVENVELDRDPDLEFEQQRADRVESQTQRFARESAERSAEREPNGPQLSRNRTREGAWDERFDRDAGRGWDNVDPLYDHSKADNEERERQPDRADRHRWHERGRGR